MWLTKSCRSEKRAEVETFTKEFTHAVTQSVTESLKALTTKHLAAFNKQQEDEKKRLGLSSRRRRAQSFKPDSLLLLQHRWPLLIPDDLEMHKDEMHDWLVCDMRDDLLPIPRFCELLTDHVLILLRFQVSFTYTMTRGEAIDQEWEKSKLESDVKWEVIWKEVSMAPFLESLLHHPSDIKWTKANDGVESDFFARLRRECRSLTGSFNSNCGCGKRPSRSRKREQMAFNLGR